MKIQKAIFSVSDSIAYNSYWNTQSKLYRVGLGIEPICLLFGKKSDTDMTEEYGKIIEMEKMSDLPWVPQMTWSKFDYTRTEPETTWIIGDVDLLPLSRYHFIDTIAGLPDDHYAHLNGGGISGPRLGRLDGFLTDGSERHGKDGGFPGADVPAHYHVGKGKLFEKIYFPGQTFRQTIEYIANSDRYGMGVMANMPKENINPTATQHFWYYWLAEENYSSEKLWNAIKSKQIDYHHFTYDNGGQPGGQRVWQWDAARKDYIYDAESVRRGRAVDIHCRLIRPFSEQAEALNRLIDCSGMLK